MTKKADDLAHVDMKTCSLVVGEGVTSLEAEMVFFNYYYVRFTTVVASEGCDTTVNICCIAEQIFTILL